VDSGIAERKTAADYLKALEDAGLLKMHKVGRENLFLNVKLYALLSKQPVHAIDTLPQRVQIIVFYRHVLKACPFFSPPRLRVNPSLLFSVLSAKSA
jgi:hypothetical protein